MPPFLFLLWALVPFGTEAGEIIGGTEVTPHSRPYMAYIRAYDLKSVQASCVGFLVRRDIVITSAICTGSQINVTLGAHYITRKEHTQEVIPVVKAIHHEDYNKNLLINDIMLLKLQYKAQVTAAVNTIALPTSQDWVGPRQVCSVAGWGLLDNGKLSDTLQEVDLEVQSAQTCNDIFFTYNNTIQLCAGDPKGKKRPSRGDSGAPLVCNSVAEGIVSYGPIRKPPVVFTRISHYISWIEKNIKLLEDL